jgi:hypothetical protein
MPGRASAPVSVPARQWGMRNYARSIAAIVTVTAAVGLAACSSGPSYAHPWCAPLIAQFHAHQAQAAYVAGLQSSGAPVGKLVTDIGTYEQDQATANVPGIASFSAGAAEPGDLAVVSGDLKQLNAECGQAADAYKSDNV